MKGSILDTVTIPIYIFALAIGLVLLMFVTNIIQDIVLEDNDLNSTYINNSVSAVQMFDFNFPLIVVLGLFGGAIIMSLMIPTHPIFIPISLIILAISIFLCSLFSNIYMEMFTDTDLSSASDDFSYTGELMTNLPMWLTIFGGLAFFVGLYLKSSGGSL